MTGPAFILAATGALRSDNPASSTPTGPFDEVGQVDISKGSWTAGGTVGANWQLNPSWLIGLEGDLGYLANDRRFLEWNDTRVTAGVKTSGYATARARFGYVTGASLLYATGGAAFVRVENTFGGCGLDGLRCRNCHPSNLGDVNQERLDRGRRYRNQTEPQLDPENRISLRRCRHHEFPRRSLHDAAPDFVPERIPRHQDRPQLQVRRSGRSLAVLRRRHAADRS